MPSSKIKCADCNKVIKEGAVMALGKFWHKEHFTCVHCKKQLKEGRYIQEGEKAYCERDWKVLFQNPNLAICAHCNLPIKETPKTALGKTWHKEHFICAHCKKPLKDTLFITEDGKPYCEADHRSLFQDLEKQSLSSSTSVPTQAPAKIFHLPTCEQCKEPITGTVTFALGKTWHKEHFHCTQCRTPFNDSSFYVGNGNPYCYKDYIALFSKKCSACGDTIQDTILTALNKYWHKQCFTCSKCKKPITAQQEFLDRKGVPFCTVCDHLMCVHCKKQLKDAKYVLEGGKAYCERDWKALFQNPNLAICAYCNMPIKETPKSALGRTWHEDHFVCAHCKKPFKDTKFFTEDGKPYCEADHRSLFQDSEKQSLSSSTSVPTQAPAQIFHFPTCEQCKELITGTVTFALGKTWHKEHFHCTQCRTPFNDSGFSVENGKPYCFKDYIALFSKKCSACGETIQDTILTALNKYWHKQCFTCSKCKQSITAQQEFLDRKGVPFCTVCAGR